MFNISRYYAYIDLHPESTLEEYEALVNTIKKEVEQNESIADRVKQRRRNQHVKEAYCIDWKKRALAAQKELQKLRCQIARKERNLDR